MYKPPFTLTSKILGQASEITEMVGELKTYAPLKVSVKLRKENKIRTIHHSLAIEGNILTEDQVTAILENKRVMGPSNQIKEVINAMALYDDLNKFSPTIEKDLLKAHTLLLKDLIPLAGKYRAGAVGVFKGSKISHVAPSAKQVPSLMKDLFDFLKQDKETPWLIKACVFHYELEFIHPFQDGNGRMGRLWQQLLLMKQSPLFEFSSVESLIHKNQKQYYKVLEQCDRVGDSTLFIEFSLDLILKALQDFKDVYQPIKPKTSDRIEEALINFGDHDFSRKDYLKLHKGISTATASRDLLNAVNDGLIIKNGDKALARYQKQN